LIDVKRELPHDLRIHTTPVDPAWLRIRRNVLIPTAYGQMIVNRFDTAEAFAGVGGQLLLTGQYDPDEMLLLRNLVEVLPPEPVVLDVGANIGVDTLVMAYACEAKGGRIHAFEPQRQVFQVLCGNMALNSLDNVHCLNCAVGREPGRLRVPALDYNRNASFGSLELGRSQREAIGQEPRADGAEAETVEVRTIDGMGLARIDLIKLDVEGMELEALAGARESLAKFRPLLHLEWIKSDVDALLAFLDEAGYDVWKVDHNLLALPKGWTAPEGAPALPAPKGEEAGGTQVALRNGPKPPGRWAVLYEALRSAERAFRHTWKGKRF
jgi:FkbM family methyltransferase